MQQWGWEGSTSLGGRMAKGSAVPADPRAKPCEVQVSPAGLWRRLWERNKCHSCTNPTAKPFSQISPLGAAAAPPSPSAKH